MALNYDPDAQQGIFGSIKGALGLFSDTNKADGLHDDLNPAPVDEYESTMPDVEILSLTSNWKRTYAPYYTEIERTQNLSTDYWVGKHKSPDGTSNSLSAAGVADNLIFESIETFLPIATRANPDPLVTADPSDIGQQIANDIKVALAHEADVQKLRRKLAKVTRSWMLNRLGVLKVSWNPVIKSIETMVVNPKRLILDRDGYIDEGCQFVGEYIGEKKKNTTEKLIEMFPKRKAEIISKAKGKLGTTLEYFEWWYCGKDVFYTMDDIVLGKFKNPNWNYDGETTDKDVEGNEVVSPVQGTNHMKIPSYPYRFLSIFSTGEQPHDNTSLILQNIAGQDIINKRENQIDRNVEGMNNGMVVSGAAFTEEQASQAAAALRRGVAIRVPNGDVQKAVMFPEKPGLPADVFHSLDDRRAQMRNIFGTAGSTAEGVKSQDTVRGKILINQMDSSRIGGGITEFIEQLADSIYNLWVQFMFVYYDEEHFIVSAGASSGLELIALKNSQFPLLKTLDITVKEGSMIPKDPLTQRNEAIDLWSANAIDPLTLFKRLEVPDPVESTNQLILWQMLQKGQIQPQMYLPTFALAGQQPGQLPTQQPGTGGPAVSAVNGPDVSPQPTPGTPEPVAQQSQQLLASEPLPKV